MFRQDEIGNYNLIVEGYIKNKGKTVAKVPLSVSPPLPTSLLPPSFSSSSSSPSSSPFPTPSSSSPLTLPGRRPHGAPLCARREDDPDPDHPRRHPAHQEGRGKLGGAFLHSHHQCSERGSLQSSFSLLILVSFSPPSSPSHDQPPFPPHILSPSLSSSSLIAIGQHGILHDPPQEANGR